MTNTTPGATPRSDWGSPRWLVRMLADEFGSIRHCTKRKIFELDPAANKTNACALKWFGPGSQCAPDGLAETWSEWADTVFFNPPRSGRELPILPWLAKAAAERHRCSVIVGLIPVNTETVGWQEHIWGVAHEVRFLRPRLRYEGADHGATFASAVVIWRPGRVVQTAAWGWDLRAEQKAARSRRG